MALVKSLMFLCSDLEKHIVAEDEKLYVKEKGVITDEIQGTHKIIILVTCLESSSSIYM